MYMQKIFFTLCLIGLFGFRSVWGQEPKTYKEFDPNKIEIWKRVSEVNDIKKQQYSVLSDDSLVRTLNLSLRYIRLYYKAEEISKIEAGFVSGERRDFLWWNRQPLLIGVMKEGSKDYNVQYYFLNGVLYETKHKENLSVEDEATLIQQSESLRGLGLKLIKIQPK